MPRDTEIIGKIRAKYQLDNHLRRFHATDKKSWFDFEYHEHSITEFSSGLVWIFALKIFDGLHQDRNISPKISNVSSDVLFLECLLFIECGVGALSQDSYWEEGIFESFHEVIEIVSIDIPDLFDILEKDSENLFQDRAELYCFIKGVINNYYKAVCHQFVKVVRSRADTGNNDICNLTIKDYPIELDHDLNLRTDLQLLAESYLHEYIAIIKRTQYSSDDY